jgi:hypothetical protein
MADLLALEEAVLISAGVRSRLPNVALTDGVLAVVTDNKKAATCRLDI